MGIIKDVEAGACLASRTFVAQSNHITAYGATLPGLGIHQQRLPSPFVRCPPTGVSSISISTPSLCQSRWGLNSRIPPS